MSQQNDCNYPQRALEMVRKGALPRTGQWRAFLHQICDPLKVDPQQLIRQLLACPVTVNFHIDRLAPNGETVLTNLMRDGEYRGQFQTGISNGGVSAYPGGERFLWEQHMFSDSYPDDVPMRPKYGALNLLRYPDGASMRFGACYLSLNPQMVSRCSFSYGDSSGYPETCCTADTFEGIAAALLEQVQTSSRLLNLVVSSPQEALSILLWGAPGAGCILGRNLDYCIESHIHGELSLERDVESLWLDGSYRGTIWEQQARTLCQQYHMALEWIPARRLALERIDVLFRGPNIPAIAQRIVRLFGDGEKFIDANRIGLAAQDSICHPERWNDFGNQSEVYRSLKQLWHMVGYFG